MQLTVIEILTESQWNMLNAYFIKLLKTNQIDKVIIPCITLSLYTLFASRHIFV